MQRPRPRGVMLKMQKKGSSLGTLAKGQERFLQLCKAHVPIIWDAEKKFYYVFCGSRDWDWGQGVWACVQYERSVGQACEQGLEASWVVYDPKVKWFEKLAIEKFGN